MIQAYSELEDREAKKVTGGSAATEWVHVCDHCGASVEGTIVAMMFRRQYWHFVCPVCGYEFDETKWRDERGGFDD